MESLLSMRFDHKGFCRRSLGWWVEIDYAITGNGREIPLRLLQLNNHLILLPSCIIIRIGTIGFPMLMGIWNRQQAAGHGQGYV